MKKYIFMAVAGMLALSSCSNDDNDVQNTQNAPRQMTFTAGFGDDGLTRASLSGKSVSFDTNDAFSILSAINTTAVQFTTTDGTNFSGTAADAPEFYAVYPHKAGYTYDGSLGIISSVTIPTEQNNAASSPCGWDPSAPIAYATTTGTSLLFHNACALLKITNDKGEAGVIEVGCDQALTGTFSLNTSNGTLSGTAPQGGAYVQSVPLNKTIYIAIAPGTKTNFIADWVGTGSAFAMKQKSSFTFEAGKIYDLGKTSEW